MDKHVEKENLTFHYKREERLAHAPLIVQQSYSGELPQPPKGLFKALVHTKGSRFMLIVLIFTLVITLGMLTFGPQENVITFKGIHFSMSAFSFNETVYISIKTEAKTNTPEIEFVDLSFSYKDKDDIEIASQEFSFSYNKIGDYIRTTIRDYDIISVYCLISSGAESETIKCTVEQK